MRDKLNYGLALSHDGDYQIINTSHHPGIRDDYSLTLSGPFTYFVAPANYIDHFFKLDQIPSQNYYKMRESLLKYNSAQLKDAILAYHGVQTKNKNTWA
jgi:hypothetical protein